MRARFKRPGIENSWRYGIIINPRCVYDADVDAANIRDDKTGGVMTVSREHVQINTRGPRGGSRWQPL